MAQTLTREVDAGLLIYRFGEGGPEILLVHPGGPFFSRKDGPTWSIPKGAVEQDDVLAAARRQFTSDTGLDADGAFVALAPIEQKGKLLHAYAVECNLDLQQFHSGEFSLEWPPTSGRFERFPEVEQIQYFDLRTAVRKILPPQWPLLLEVSESLGWKIRRPRRG